MCKPLTKRWSEGAEKVHLIKKDYALAQQDPELMLVAFIEWLEAMGDRYWEVVVHSGSSDQNYLMRMLMDYKLLSRFQALCRPMWTDTYELAKKKKEYIGSKNLKLGTLVKHFGWEINAHDALEDCKGCCFVHQQLEAIQLPNANRVNLNGLEGMSKKEKIKKFMQMKYLQYGSDGCLLISKHALASKDAMETILTELWDKHCN